MIPIEFKTQWSINKFDKWIEFDNSEIEESPLTDITKNFFKFGFPSDAAPFLNFGWTSYGNKFLNISDCYPSLNLNSSAKNYWILGSDGAGNPICFDISRNDRIVLLDHEQRFELMAIINKNIQEFAECLLLYKNFIKRIQDENGEEAFLDENISDNQLSDLKGDFKSISNDIFKESGFWRTEINSLGK